MSKINYPQFKKNLEETGKTYFNWHDLKKFYPGSKESLKVLVSSWVKKKLIYRLSRGYYSLNLSQINYLQLACNLDKNSYISFEYALYFYNLIDQVPSTITLATKKRSHKVAIANWNFEYTHLKNTLFFDYELKDKVYITSPEKALADLIYLIARGKRIAELDTLERKKINQKKLRQVLKKFPKYVEKTAEEMGILK